VSGHRVERMASTVRMIVSDAIRNKLNDPRISPLSSVTRVELSGDLLIAKVFISVYGKGADERKTLIALRHAKGRIQGIVAKNLKARQCPEIRLELDETIKRTNETLGLIERTMREHREDRDANSGEESGDGAGDASTGTDEDEGL
jgi:ribosome-binding factor A